MMDKKYYHFALQGKNEELLEALENGIDVDVNEKDHNGDTLMHFGIDYNFINFYFIFSIAFTFLKKTKFDKA